MKSEARLRPMKRAYGSRKDTGASLHANAASASRRIAPHHIGASRCIIETSTRIVLNLIREAFFGNEANLRCMKNEARLRPMKRAYGSRKGTGALLHASAASASRRIAPHHFGVSRCIIKYHCQNVNFMLYLTKGRGYYGKR